MRDYLLQKLKCPKCSAIKLDMDTDAHSESNATETIICSECLARFAVDNGIPVFLKQDIRDVKNLDMDREKNLVDHDNWKKMQVRFYADQFANHDAVEHEIHRPYGQSRLYEFMQHYDLTVAARAFKGTFRNKEILSFGCGGGMDAEFFVRRGALVSGLDISVDHLDIARKRFQARHGEFNSLCCDAENVPIQDDSFDICYAFDALHHCPSPYKVIEEMVRVSREAVIIMEPHHSPLITLSVKLGTTDMWESSGNYKHYFRKKELDRFLREHGVQRVEHYYSFFKKFHHQPEVFRVLSRSPFFHVVKGALFVMRKSLGSLSNHCIVIGYT